MNVLFVHNNFPAQFRNLAEALAGNPVHSVAAIGCETARDMGGVRLQRYASPKADLSATHPFARRFDLDCRRAEQTLFAAGALRDVGFTPDLIVAHCGWGEHLPLRAVFPKARLAIYCEYYYRAEGQDVNFDEVHGFFGVDGNAGVACLNAATLVGLAECDVALSPTEWQRSTYPAIFRDKIGVVHEGVDTDIVSPDPLARFALPGGRELTRSDEIVTYISRSLEPMRGFHVFLRALPALLAARPRAEIVIVGGEQPSYGPPPPEGDDWKSYLLRGALPQLDLARVHFVGRLPYSAYLDLLRISSAHVYLTFPFVLSWSLIEAMSAGCTIVASDTAPVREAIEPGVNGLLVPFHDDAALARTLAAVLEAPASHASLGAAARRTALQRYDRRACVPRALRLLGIESSLRLSN